MVLGRFLREPYQDLPTNTKDWNSKMCRAAFETVPTFEGLRDLSFEFCRCWDCEIQRVAFLKRRLHWLGSVHVPTATVIVIQCAKMTKDSPAQGPLPNRTNIPTDLKPEAGSSRNPKRRGDAAS